MKIAIGHRIQDGPWGGGNQFVVALGRALTAAGHEVVHDLAHSDIDVALLMDPRPKSPSVSFGPADLMRHLRSWPGTIVVQRINECDERKGTKLMNLRLRAANCVADHTVFISHWLRTLDVWRRHPPRAVSVIPNGADADLFFAARAAGGDAPRPIRLVTHHWGAHANKGSDVYERLGALLDTPKWAGRFSFTFVGNAPRDMNRRNITVLPPLSGMALADELRRHDAYVTASVNEPAGMHHIEGAMCGLPILFRRSGALPEYCETFGRGFWGPEDIEPALEAFLAGQAAFRGALMEYPFTASRMTAAYIDLFERLVADSTRIAAGRRADPGMAMLSRLLERVG